MQIAMLHSMWSRGTDEEPLVILLQTCGHLNGSNEQGVMFAKDHGGS